MAKKNSIIGTFANASDNVRGAKDKFYVNIKNAQEKIDEIKTNLKEAGRKDDLEEDDIRANRDYAKKLLEEIDEKAQDPQNGTIKIDGEVVEVGGPIKIDTNRKNFEQVGEFNDTKMKEGIKLGDNITDWLKGFSEQSEEEEIDEYAQYLAQKNGTNVKKNEEQVDVKKMKIRVQAAQTLKESFDTSGSFNEKIKLYNQISGLSVSEDNLTRVTNLGYIFSTYCGDLNAKNIVNAIKNNQSEIRMSNAIKSCLDGEISEEMMTQKIFAEIHGIDNTKLNNKLYSNEALIELCTLQELSPSTDIADIVANSESELKTIKNAVLTGKTFNNRGFLAEMGIQHNINKVLETGDMCITPLSVNGRSDGYICYDLGENEEINNGETIVDISMLKINEAEFVKLGEANRHGLINGNIEEITKIVTSHDIGDIERTGLVSEIDEKSKVTQKEARENAMTPEQKMAYQREVEEAVEAATNAYKRNFASGV